MLKNLKDSKGFAQFLVLFLLVAGIGLGTYLIQQRTNILPFANTQSCSFQQSTSLKCNLRADGKTSCALVDGNPTCVEAGTETTSTSQSCSFQQNTTLKCNLRFDGKTSCEIVGGSPQCVAPAGVGTSCQYDQYSKEYSCEDGQKCFNDFYKDSSTNCEFVAKNPHYHCEPDDSCKTGSSAGGSGGSESSVTVASNNCKNQSDPKWCANKHGQTSECKGTSSGLYFSDGCSLPDVKCSQPDGVIGSTVYAECKGRGPCDENAGVGIKNTCNSSGVWTTDPTGECTKDCKVGSNAPLEVHQPPGIVSDTGSSASSGRSSGSGGAADSPQDGPTIPLFGLGHYRDEDALAQSKDGAKKALENYKIYTQILDDIEKQISDDRTKLAAQKARDAIAKANNSANACIK